MRADFFDHRSHTKRSGTARPKPLLMDVFMFKYKSNRTFVLFSYNASHGLLLLRSRKTNQYPTRIDILIQDVRAMELRSWFDGIEIEEVGVSCLSDRHAKPTDMAEAGNRAYSVKGENWNGYIIGGLARSHEDEQDYMDASALF